ncbi:MAG: hypothetical protein FJ297_05565 [Planctomycetes bacterium]|nr:hypothetical protein [Planctomycetota bacterium]
MAARCWLDELRQRIAAHGLPPAYVARLVGELADHLEHVKEETMSKEADVLFRLGEPNHVVDAVVASHRPRSLLGRYSAARFLVFAVSPILSMMVLAAGGLLFLVATARGLGWVDGGGTHFGTSAKTVIPYLVTALTIVIPSAALTAAYFGLARRSGIRTRWTVVSWIVLSVLAGLAMCDVQLSELPGQSRLTVGLGVGFRVAYLGQWCQALFPLAAGLWMLGRSRKRDSERIGEGAVST